jgi:hypothetical protein
MSSTPDAESSPVRYVIHETIKYREIELGAQQRQEMKDRGQEDHVELCEVRRIRSSA